MNNEVVLWLSEQSHERIGKEDTARPSALGTSLSGLRCVCVLLSFPKVEAAGCLVTALSFFRRRNLDWMEAAD